MDRYKIWKNQQHPISPGLPWRCAKYKRKEGVMDIHAFERWEDAIWWVDVLVREANEGK